MITRSCLCRSILPPEEWSTTYTQSFRSSVSNRLDLGDADERRVQSIVCEVIQKLWSTQTRKRLDQEYLFPAPNSISGWQGFPTLRIESAEIQTFWRPKMLITTTPILTVEIVFVECYEELIWKQKNDLSNELPELQYGCQAPKTRYSSSPSLVQLGFQKSYDQAKVYRGHRCLSDWKAQDLDGQLNSNRLDSDPIIDAKWNWLQNGILVHHSELGSAVASELIKPVDASRA